MDTNVLNPQQRLLDVARRLFYNEGIHAVGVDRVIAEASVAKATLYAHFASKAELVAAYLEREGLGWVDEVEQRLAGHQPGTAAIRALFEMLYDRSQAQDYRGCPFINAAAEFPSSGPVAVQIASHRGRVRAVFVAAIGPHAATPEMLDAIVALYGGAMSAAHLDHRPVVVLHAAAAAERLLTEAPAAR